MSALDALLRVAVDEVPGPEMIEPARVELVDLRSQLATVTAERDKAVGQAYRAAVSAQALARVVLNSRSTKRWPCQHCGRTSAEAPLRGLECKTEDGLVYMGGCHECTSEHVAEAARAVLGDKQ